MPIEDWLRARRRQVVLALLALSLIVRAVYYAELSQGPCLWAHRWSESDNGFFDRWAKEIAAGDWLTNQELHPMVSWNYAIAKDYFARHPEKLAAFQAAGATNDAAAATALWNHWFGGKLFHQEPLYAYAIAITYRVFGEDVRWVFAWQMALGILTVLMLWRLSRDYFGDTAAVIAGVCAAVFAPLYYLELTLVRTTLLTFLTIAMVYMAERAFQRKRAGAWLQAGIVFGIGLLGQTTTGLVLVPCLAILAWRYRASLAMGARFAAVLLAGVLIGISPAVVRNLMVGTPAFSLASNGSMAFIGGLDASATPEMGGGGFNFTRMEQVLEETDAKSLPVLKAAIASHGGMGNFLWLLARKFAKYWQWYEEPDNQNLYYFQLYAQILRLSLTTYLLAPLMIAGVVLAAPRFEKCALLYAVAGTGIAVALLASPVARYRAGYLAATIPFAAFTLVRTAEWLRARQYKPAIAVSASVVVLFLWTSRPLPAGRHEIRTADYLAPFYYYWIPEHTAAAHAGQPRKAAMVLEGSLLHLPEEVREMRAGRTARDAYERELAQAYAQIHAQLADDLSQSGDTAGAAREVQLARQLSNAGL
jgi:4-amino-4-deoxy-L-arabinose transferase-like glycosyltransferase